MCSKAIEEYKQRLALSDEQKDVLVGLLLGDAHLETQNHGQTYRLKVEQSARHQAYVEHVYRLFEGWVQTPPQTERVVSREQKSDTVWFQTVSHSAFRFYAHQFYDGLRKRVPQLIHRWLTPRGLAYWFMDDGSIKSKESKGVILNTHCYTYSEVDQLTQVLRSSFGLQASIRTQNDGYQIYISGHSYEHLVGLIGPFVIQEMRYKLPPERQNILA